MAEFPKFIQITGDTTLHALDELGGVWTYYPARELADDKVQHAVWIKRTDKRADKTKKAS